MRVGRDGFVITMSLIALMTGLCLHCRALEDPEALSEAPSVAMFYRAVVARPTLVYEGTAVVRTRSDSRVSVARFRLYHDRDDRLRREYLTGEGKPRDIFIRTGKGLLFWRVGANQPVIRNYPKGKGVDRFGETDLILRNYDVLVEGQEPVAGRGAFRLRLHCRHGNRPPTRVWVDTQNLMILQEVRYDLSGQPQVERYFEEIRFPKKLAPTLFEAPAGVKVVDMSPKARQRQTLVRPELKPEDLIEEARSKLKGGIWLPTSIPTGFELTSVRSYIYTPDDPYRYTLHLGYSDGLTALSIFIQKGTRQTASPAQKRGADRPVSPPEVNRARDRVSGNMFVASPQRDMPDSTSGQTHAKRTRSRTQVERGVEIMDQSRASKTVLRRQEKGVLVTVIGEIDRSDLLRTIVSVEPEHRPAVELSTDR